MTFARCMKFIFAFFFACIVGTGTAVSSTVYDDFSGPLIDSAKWYEKEFVREVANGVLVSKVRSSENNARNNTAFSNPETINQIECDIVVSAATLDSTGPDPRSFARVDGRFYNTQASGTQDEGDVWAAVYIGDKGSGLQAWWEVWEIDNSLAWVQQGNGTLAVLGLATGTSYHVEISYDGSNGFNFTVGGEASGWQAFSARQRNPTVAYKGLVTGAYTDDTASSGGGSGDGYAAATFDNVETNESAYDDFSALTLDQTKWKHREFVREIANGKLRLSAHSTSNKESTRLNFSETFPYTEATVTVKSGKSWINTGAKGKARLDGTYYNDTYSGPYNDSEGEVWAQVYIDYFDDGTLAAGCYAERSDDANWNTYTELFTHIFDLPIVLERPYTLSIRFTGTMLVFTCRDNVTGVQKLFQYEITGPANPANNPGRSIISRVYGNEASGYMAAEFDNIRVNTSASIPTLSEWGMITMALMLAAFALWMVRRKTARGMSV